MSDSAVPDPVPLKIRLLEAAREWILENDMTPYVIVDAKPDVIVPKEFINDGKVVLNVHPRAVHRYGMRNGALCFAARFRGQSREVEIPTVAILAVYAKENGEGISFPHALDTTPDPDQPTPSAKEKGPAKRSRAQLRIVK